MIVSYEKIHRFNYVQKNFILAILDAFRTPWYSICHSHWWPRRNFEFVALLRNVSVRPHTEICTNGSTVTLEEFCYQSFEDNQSRSSRLGVRKLLRNCHVLILQITPIDQMIDLPVSKDWPSSISLKYSVNTSTTLYRKDKTIVTLQFFFEIDTTEYQPFVYV